MYLTTLLTLLVACPLPVLSIANRPLDFETDDDLHVFVSRPDIRAPRYDVKVFDVSKVSPGYFFVAPYSDLRDRVESTLYAPGQTGPHIYDGSGSLIWSGAHLFADRPTFDFKTATCNGTACMTFILNEDFTRRERRGGGGIIMDNSFQITKDVMQTSGRGIFNMHEFTITENNTAMLITFESKLNDVTTEKDQTEVSGWVGNNGFRELDMKTGRWLFEWWALDHVHPSGSRVLRPPMPRSSRTPWDFFHLNSIDKDDNGDYLISSRFFNTIYKISKLDGSIIWQLGGVNSSFTLLDGFNFSSQHDARFRHQNSTNTIISFFNNAADDHIFTAERSSAMIVNLDHTAMTASLLRKLDRPDNKLTHLRGNVQLLPNANEFVCWSENGRLSEFSPSGALVMDAHFTSHRFVTYRGFKLNLTAVPSEPPVLKTLIYGPSSDKSTTAMYVSWNGATEVASWRFYGSSLGSSAADSFELLGKGERTGFETVLMVSGSACQTYAEALASNGTVLGTSAVVTSILPPAGDFSSCSHSESTQHLSDLPSATKNHKHSLFNLSVESSSTFNLVLSMFVCIAILILLLCLAGWRIRKLSKQLRENVDYKYLPVAKG